jgi:hypothetical protein
MPAQPWATPAQLKFLYSKRVDFSNAQREKCLSAFWPVVYHEFFVLWPNQESESTPMPEDTLKKKKKKKETRADEDTKTEEEWIEKRKSVRAPIPPSVSSDCRSLAEHLPLVQ